MKNNFDFGELKSGLTSLQKPSIVKIASAVEEENVPSANAAEAICQVADALDEMGRQDLADTLVKSTQALLASKLVKIAEEEEKKEDDGDDEVVTVTCPYCDKEFDAVVECEENEVESIKEEKKEEEGEKKDTKEGDSDEGEDEPEVREDDGEKEKDQNTGAY
jgi:hypothetical protein